MFVVVSGMEQMESETGEVGRLDSPALDSSGSFVLSASWSTWIASFGECRLLVAELLWAGLELQPSDLFEVLECVDEVSLIPGLKGGREGKVLIA